MPKKPYPDFPLWPHPSGRWCKKIRGRAHYFGKTTDDADHGAMAALERYQEVAVDLHAGRTPRTRGDELTVSGLCNRFMTSKRQAADSGEIVEATFSNYYRCCKRIVDYFGRTRLVEDLAATDDFEGFRAALAKTRGATALSLEITQVRTVFKYAFDRGLVQQPIRYGGAFNKPSQKAMRLARNGVSRMYESSELRLMLDNAEQPLKTFILLGLNCAYGPTDIGRLPRAALDLDAAWVQYARSKTGIERRAPLWLETIQGLRETVEDTGELAFRTASGGPWVTQAGKRSAVSPLFQRLLKRLGLYRKGVGFYALRHVFRTLADEVHDTRAADAIMGHTDDSMAARYVERIDDCRLIVVTDHVRQWLFGTKGE